LEIKVLFRNGKLFRNSIITQFSELFRIDVNNPLSLTSFESKLIKPFSVPRRIPVFLTAVADFATARSRFSFLLHHFSVRHLSSVHNCDTMMTPSKSQESELGWLGPVGLSHLFQLHSSFLDFRSLFQISPLMMKFSLR
jgi:hypothetical protein